MDTFHTFQDILAWLDKLGLFKVQLGLERMNAALEACGLVKAPFVMAQVVGTNGKGSTATFLDSVARAHGVRAGLYTSPHFVSPKERILVDGRQVSDADWICCANRLMNDVPGARDLSYFEFLTVLAMLLFERHGIELAVIEAGLGGKNDATTALGADFQLFTPIDMDHAAIIGPDLADIAMDKAWAINPGSLVFSARQSEVAAGIISKMSKNRGARLEWAAESAAPVGLAGAHQRVNAALASLAWQKIAPRLGIGPDERAFAAGLCNAFIPGRLQMIEGNPPLLLDGAHNPHALRKVLPEAKKILGEDVSIVFSVLADKNWPEMLAILAGHFPRAHYFTPPLGNPRALSAAAIADGLNSLLPDMARAVKDTKEALRLAARNGLPVLAIGSLYLLSEIYALHPEFLCKTGDAPNGK